MSAFYDIIRQKVMYSAIQTNKRASQKNRAQNAEMFGKFEAYAEVLQEFGHEVEYTHWEDECGGLVRIGRIRIGNDSTWLGKGFDGEGGPQG